MVSSIALVHAAIALLPLVRHVSGQGISSTSVPAHPEPYVNTQYGYGGPAVPVGDFVDPSYTEYGTEKDGAYTRLIEPPAVQPSSNSATNNYNVISLTFLPTGVNIHVQTPAALSTPTVMWGTSPSSLINNATGTSRSYQRTPPCSQLPVTLCSEYFHDVQITGLPANTMIYYQLPAISGTTASQVLSVKTAMAPGTSQPFNISIVADMGRLHHETREQARRSSESAHTCVLTFTCSCHVLSGYTNAQGTVQQMYDRINETAFILHGGDLSYADDWYSGLLPCASDWPVCYGGSEAEVPSQGGPNGGDMRYVQTCASRIETAQDSVTWY